MQKHPCLVSALIYILGFTLYKMFKPKPKQVQSVEAPYSTVVARADPAWNGEQRLSKVGALHGVCADPEW